MPNSGPYFKSLNPVVKEQYKENLTGDNGPYSDRASRNTVYHVAPGVVCCGI